MSWRFVDGEYRHPEPDGGKPHVLIVDDEKQFIEDIYWFLKEEYCLSYATGWTNGKKIFYGDSPDVVLLDIELKEEYDGLDVLREIRRNGYADQIVIIISQYLGEKNIRVAREEGADQWIKKTEFEELGQLVSEAISANLTKRLGKIAERNVRDDFVHPVFVSPTMIRVRDRVERFIDMDETILITGETGSGKDVLAKWIHRQSARRNGPFCTVNLPGLTDSLFTLELFGHEKGVFTDAKERRVGLLELARGGTIVLDEIGELKNELQVKLLYVMQNKSFMRLGGRKPITLNVRFIALTNRNLDDAVGGGTFRKDLYYRLKTFHVEVPPLRERKEDIPIIANHFLRRYSKKYRKNMMNIDAGLERALMEYRWPGNVRELEQWIINGLAYAEDSTLRLKDISGMYQNIPMNTDDHDEVISNAMKECRKKGMDPLHAMTYEKFKEAATSYYVKILLTRTNGDVSAAARLADVPRESLYRLCRKYGIRPSDYR